ncbi:hypothetical protein [Flavobacterium sp. '19STA2R22 D10 B1']|uniref:hypothetical protein n=1 Tax=Flavobacterium aerium TaxID=3037261 RepID=UPI00278C3257|nr:hypothetical protein [Flavobacterium sp. '19STA2R22 D10 B1']
MRKIILFSSLLFSMFMMGQTKETVVPPMEVDKAFQKEFPNIIPVWKSDYRGMDDTEIRYEAEFKKNGAKNLAVYDRRGDLITIEVAMKPSKLSKPILKYLKENNYTNKIVEVVKVADEANMISYQVGVTVEGKSFDLIFDEKGEYIETKEVD